MNFRVSILCMLFCLVNLTLVGQDKLNMDLVYHWEDATIPPAFFINNTYNEIWGWHDEVKDREYAIIGSSIGTHFFDITDTSNVVQVDFVAGKADDMIHRDYKNKGEFLFMVADEWESSLQVVDMSYLPDSVHLVYDSDTLFQISHNIWIEGNRMYACVPRNVSPGFPPGANFGLYDIADPANPILIDTYNQYGVVHDLYSRNDTVYLNTEFAGLRIVDMTDPLNPNLIGSVSSYPFQGYNHSGWLTDDGKYYVFADETHGMPLKVLNVQDFDNLAINSFLFPSLDFMNRDSSAIGHNPLIVDNFVFVSYYYDGVYVFDITDPIQPTLAGFYDTYPAANDEFYRGVWGVYPLLPSGLVLASDMQTGLYVFSFDGFQQDSTTTNIEPDLNTAIRFSPNPARDWVNVLSSLPQQDVQIELYDMQGKLLQKEELDRMEHSYRFTLSPQLPKGIYVLSLRSKQTHYKQKLVIH
ncbi:MAG: choice-of-anchor B family protein [Bacteroidota bacterium]